MARSELEVGRLLQPELDYERPATRADCVDGPRPCPFVSCSHHLYLDVSIRTGSIKMNFPDLDVWELEETCALDVADRGRHSDSSLAEILNLTREGVRRLEKRAMERAQLLLRRWNGD